MSFEGHRDAKLMSGVVAFILEACYKVSVGQGNLEVKEQSGTGKISCKNQGIFRRGTLNNYQG